MKHRNPYKSVSKGTPSECPEYTSKSTGAAREEIKK